MSSVPNGHGRRKPPRVSAYVHPELAAALATLLRLLAPSVRAAEDMAVDAGAVDDWVDQKCSPLGPREHCRACAEGKIEGAHKLKRRWLAPRRAVNAYIQTYGAPSKSAPASGTCENDDDAPSDADIASVLHTAGFAYTPRRGKGEK